MVEPWHANVGKRQVKAPRVYLADSGTLHSLLGLTTMADLESHPKLGASWEGFLLGQVVQRLEVPVDECFFWRTHTGAELDLLIVRGRQRYGFEFKRTETPKVTPSMRSAIADLELTQLDVIHAGEHTFDLDERIRAVSAYQLIAHVRRPR